MNHWQKRIVEVSGYVIDSDHFKNIFPQHINVDFISVHVTVNSFFKLFPIAPGKVFLPHDEIVNMLERTGIDLTDRMGADKQLVKIQLPDLQ